MDVKKINLSEEAQEFLFYSYFGENHISIIKDKEVAKLACFKRAYRDFCRTISIDEKNFKEQKNIRREVNSEEDVGFAIDVFEGRYGGERLTVLFDQIICMEAKRDFNELHKELCCKIIQNAEKIPYLKGKGNYKEKLFLGQAQKWLNMTIKYMFFTGSWNDQFAKVKKNLHIPIDSYILKATFYEGEMRDALIKKRLIKEKEVINKKYANSEGALIIREWKNENFDCNYKNSKGGKADTVTWSKIKSYEDYKIVQDKVKACIPKNLKVNPIKWENKVWIEASEQS